MLEELEAIRDALEKVVGRAGFLRSDDYAMAGYTRLLTAERELRCAAHLYGPNKEEPCDEAVYY